MANTLLIYTTHLLRQHLRTALFWALGFGIYAMLIVLTFPSFRDSGALSMENYPDAIVEAFNMQDMSQITNFLESQVTSYAPLVIVFFAIMTFASAIAGAEEAGALDITLGTPLPRRELVLAHWIAVGLLLLLLLTVTALLTWLAAVAVDVDLGLGITLKAFLNIFPIVFAFGSLALALSARLRSRGAVIGITFGVVFLMYLIDIIGKIETDMDGMRYVSAFRYYGSVLMDGLDRGNIAVLLGAAVVLLLAAITIFDRRDIYT